MICYQLALPYQLKKYNKISKYKDLDIELQKMWYLKIIIVSAIMKALRMIKKETDKKIPGSPSLNEIQKKWGIVHFLRRVWLMWMEK